jgi:CTP synthase (UTP-ammonia lyase)
MARIGLIGDYNEQVKAHIAIPRALRLAADELGCEVEAVWIATPELERDPGRRLAEFDALWCVPASPYASMEGALNGIRFAREHGVPFLGSCGGFQHMIIEFARNVLSLEEADHAETNPAGSVLLVAPLSCVVSERSFRFRLVPDTLAARSYGSFEIEEQYGTCNYGLVKDFAPRLEQAGLRIAGRDEDGEIRVMELSSHPFFVGTLFQPERSAFAERIHPLIKSYVQAAISRTQLSSF